MFPPINTANASPPIPDEASYGYILSFIWLVVAIAMVNGPFNGLMSKAFK